jgi:Tol biopolymer transport system component
MGRIGSSSVSPDGKQIAYTVSYYSVKENKSHTVIYVMNADGTNNLLLTHTADSEVEPTWIKGGSKIAFLTAASGSMQIWEMNPDGSERKQLSSYEGGIEGFKFSPDESKVLFISQVKYGQRTSDIYPDLDKASGKVINDLMYKHWDEWVENIPHPFVASFDGNQVGTATDILKGEPYESPMKPFGGIEQLAWSNDSKQIAYTCRKKTGLEYSVSTDSDIYLYNTEAGETRNLCKEDATDKNLGYDTNPKFSPDGKSIAWQSMERDGYESDRNRLCVMDLKSGEKTYVTEAFQSGVDDYCWAPDGKTLYFVGVWHATSMVHSTNLKGEVKQLTDGMYDYTSVAMLNNKQLLTKRHSLSEADELFTVDLKKKNAVNINKIQNFYIMRKGVLYELYRI